MVVRDFPIETDTIIIGAGPAGYVAATRPYYSIETKGNSSRNT
jgi:ribulose 1,5-bisphosphate synthetase/thiazole synthase